MKEKLGTKNLIKALDVIIDFAHKIKDAKSDGKVDILEHLHLVASAAKFGQVFLLVPKINEELKDLSPAEREQVTEYFESKFDLSNDQLEERLETALEALLAFGFLIEIFEKQSK